MHRGIEPAGIAALEIGTPAAADQQAIAGERHSFAVEEVGQAARGMPRRRPDRQIALAERDLVAVVEKTVRAFRAAFSRQRDLTAETMTQQPGPRDVIGVNMGLQGIDQLEAEFSQQGRVAAHLFVDRVDQNRLARAAVSQQVRIGRGLRIEELAKKHLRRSQAKTHLSTAMVVGESLAGNRI